MRLAYLWNTRPDCLFEIWKPPHVKKDHFNADRSILFRLLNRATEYVLYNIISLKVPKIDFDSPCRWLLWSVFLKQPSPPKQAWVHLFSFWPLLQLCAYNISIFQVKESCDVLYWWKFDRFQWPLWRLLHSLFWARIDLQSKDTVYILTYSKSLFDFIFKSSCTSEKRMMLDIAAAREGFRDNTISNIELDRSSINLSDGLTNSIVQSSKQNVISTVCISVNPKNGVFDTSNWNIAFFTLWFIYVYILFCEHCVFIVLYSYFDLRFKLSIYS